jgi:putative DNA primase/helicase
MLEWALKYAGLGWLVVPLHNPVDGGCSCRSPDCVTKRRVGKHPRIAGGVNNASSDPKQIRRWWKKWPDANIGVATGPVSGLLVLDVDGKAGRESFYELRDEGCLRKTLISFTGRTDENGKRDGMHLICQYPDHTKIGNSAGQLAKGIDVRGAGGYFVAPPSLHFSALHYRWKDFQCPIATPNDQLIARLNSIHADAEEPLGTDPIHEGERNTRLFRMAKAWRRKGIAREEIQRRLADLNSRMCKPPLPQEEIVEIVRNVFRYVKIGPDPVQAAWKKTAAEGRHSMYGRFISLARNLQRAQPELPILLPVVLVSQLMGCDRSLMTRFRKRAIRTGVMEVVEEYVPRRKATTFKVLLPD